MTARLISLSVEAFRGFADRQTLPLDADVILLTGGNGVGKTSVVDAMTWTLIGRLPHLERVRRRRNEEVVVNRYRAGLASAVTLVIDADGRRVEATRTGTSLENTLQLEAGGKRISGSRASVELAETFGAESHEELASAVERWGVLRQDELRAVLNVHPDEVHSRLRDLLGLGELDDFDASLKAVVEKRQGALTQVADLLGGAKTRLEQARTSLAKLDLEAANTERLGHLEDALTDVLRANEPLIEISPRPERNARDYRSVLGTLRSTFEAFRDHLSALSVIETRLGQLSVPEDSTSGLEARRKQLNEERDRLASEVRAAEVRLAEVQSRADGATRLAAAASPLLGERCPVCRQTINEAHVRGLLDRISGSAAAELSAAIEQLGQAQRAWGLQESELRLAEAELRERRVNETEIARLVTERNSIIESIRSFATTEKRVRVVPGTIDPEGLRATVDALSAVAQAVRALLTTLEELPRGDRSRLEAEQIEAEDKIEAMSPEVERLRMNHRRLDELYRAMQEEAVEVTGAELEALNPLFSEVYRRLAPHPTFTDLELEHDLYRRRGRTMPVLSDPLLEVEANPQVICSVGQLNVVALSYFLALTLMARERSLPFMIMDDPLQSLDDVNVLGFADFCRRLRTTHQLMITTHDRRFGELLARKLTPRDRSVTSLQLNFTGWTRQGPAIEITHLETQPGPHLLEAAV
jgi:DNA repair exonuclease SbcCD ATPase subunit